MPILLRCQILLLLTMVSFVKVLGGRHLPAAPFIFTESSTPTPQIEFSASAGLTAEEEMGFSVVTSWARGRYYQRLSPPPPPTPTPTPNISIFRGSFESANTIYGHRLLLGSAPPSCQGKCGACVPCFPIHVSLGGPHGSLTEQEYYPEAWRCKCDNRTFMP